MNFTHDMIKPIQIKIEKRSANQNNHEKLTSSYSGGKVILQGADESLLLYGKNQLEIAMKSGYLKEYLGESQPKLSLRPLWVKGDQPLDSDSCNRILEYGFNAVITDQKKIPTSKLKTIVPVKFKEEKLCFFDREYQEKVQEIFSGLNTCDYVLWEGTFTNASVISHAKAEQLLEEEVALFEARLLESVLPKGVSLIYYLPALNPDEARQQSEWFLDFCDDVGNQTVVAFPAVAGDFKAEHQPLHPFWEKLRQSLDACHTPLLPVMNVGLIDQGRGFWPHLPFDRVYDVISRCTHGAASVINRIPRKGALLDATLWVTGQMLWNGTAPNKLAETWFSAMRPELNYQKHLSDLKKVDFICCELSRLKELRQGEITHEMCRETVESIIGQIKKLHSNFSQTKNSKNKLSFFDYFTYFARDASKILLHFLQQQNIPMTSLFRSEELEESFWTEAEEGSKGQVELLEEPKAGEPGSVMNKIYLEVYGYDSRAQSE